jgi:cell wall assembly regulator SMI1
MFSFFTSKTKSAASAHPSQHARGASQAQNDLPTWRTSVQQNGSTQEGGYDDVSLSVHSQVDLSRPSFSAPSPTSGDFINSFNESSSYPPTSSSHLPPMTGYPPLRTTFYRLQSLLASRSPALLDSLSPAVPSYSPALASLLHTIRPYTLPLAVLDAYACHDGQDPFSTNGGLLWGLRWMPLDEVETEYLFWRKLEGAGGEGGMWDAFSASTGVEPSGGEGSGREHPYQGEAGEEERGGGVEGMRSFPPGWVRSRYSHPGWIPLASDGMGNYLGVDLDPPPPPSAVDGNAAASGSETRRYGAAGQVIAFGREMDEKVVLFPGDSNGGWGRFLSSFVDDVERGNFARLEVGDGSGSEEEGADGDGIGERSYLEGDRYGEEDDISGCW